MWSKSVRSEEAKSLCCPYLAPTNRISLLHVRLLSNLPWPSVKGSVLARIFLFEAVKNFVVQEPKNSGQLLRGTRTTTKVPEL